MFDLGQRKDTENCAPSVLKFFETYGKITIPKDIIDLLTEGGIQPESIDAVVWRCVGICINELRDLNEIPFSHIHVDHTGDMTKFPSKTQLFVGQGTVRDTYPTKPDATLLESDF
ncbi:hypothetical protein H0H93_000454, partial [Arthromyces matolae]